MVAAALERRPGPARRARLRPDGWVAAACSAALAAQSPAVLVQNPHDCEVATVLRASVPFAPGELTDPGRLRIGGAPAGVLPLLRWPDGSLRVVQLQHAITLAPDAAVELPVTIAAEPAVPDAPPPRFPVLPPLGCELVDAWQRVWRAELQPDPCARQLGAIVATPLVQVHRLIGALRDAGGAELLGVVAYVTRFADSRRAELTLLLDNGASPHLQLAPVGPLRFRRFTLVATDARLRARPRWIRENGILPPAVDETGAWRQDLLGPADTLYLGDRTGKAWQFDLFWDDGATAAEREAAGRLAATPVSAWCDLDAIRRSQAFGLHGGPGPAAAAGFDPCPMLVARWHAAAELGPFGGFGDARDPLSAGGAREAPSALHAALRHRSGDLLRIAGAIALQQTLRPTPGCAPRQPADTAAFRTGMSSRVVERPHGWVPLGYEQFAVDLLFELYWLTGDPLARDELHRIGSGLPALLAGVPFRTARGDGLCLRAGVMIATATGDRALLERLAAHAREHLLPVLGAAPASYALAQPGHERVFGPDEPFDAPWQMSQLLRGLHALHGATGAPEFAQAALQIADVMAGPGWLDGRGPKTFVSARDAGRYIFADRDDPLAATRGMSIGAYVLAEELTADPAARERYRLRAGLLAQERLADPVVAQADPWLQLWLDRQHR